MCRFFAARAPYAIALPATGAELMQAVADIFHNRQDDFDDGAEELGDLHRPWRDDAAERHALAMRAGHVTVPSRGVRVRVFAGEAATRTFSPAKNLEGQTAAGKALGPLQQPEQGITKAMCPAAVAPGTLSNSDIFQIARFRPRCQETGPTGAPAVVRPSCAPWAARRCLQSFPIASIERPTNHPE